MDLSPTPEESARMRAVVMTQVLLNQAREIRSLRQQRDSVADAIGYLADRSAELQDENDILRLRAMAKSTPAVRPLPKDPW